MEEVIKNLTTLVAVVTGGLITLVAAYIADRRRDRTDRQNKLRSAYAVWFTSHEVLQSEIRILLTLGFAITEAPNSNPIIAKTEQLERCIERMTASGYEILLLERNKIHQSRIKESTERWADIDEILRTVAFHSGWNENRSAKANAAVKATLKLRDKIDARVEKLESDKREKEQEQVDHPALKVIHADLLELYNERDRVRNDLTFESEALEESLQLHRDFRLQVAGSLDEVKESIQSLRKSAEELAEQVSSDEWLKKALMS